MVPLPAPEAEVESLVAALRAQHGLAAVTLDPTPLGYSNRSHRVRADGREYILRISYRGKPAAKVRREEQMLAHLARRAPTSGPIYPTLVPTRSGRLHFLRAGRRHHLFHRLPGEVRYGWRDVPAPADLGAAARALAALHGALLSFDGPAADPLRGFARGLRRALLSPPEGEPLWPVLAPLWPAFAAGARALLLRARALPLSRCAPQWVQGDFQLENLLFSPAVVCVLDFDNARASLRELDLVFSLLSLVRDGHREDEFSYDRTLLRRGMGAYQAATADLPLPLCEDAMAERHMPLWEGLFCLDQCLLHLDSVRREQWRLVRGIGFWPCYLALACAASSASSRSKR